MEPQNMALIFFVWVILCKEGLDYKTRYLPWTRQKLTNSDPILVSDTDRSNENGTLTNKHYWNEGTLNGDKIH